MIFDKFFKKKKESAITAESYTDEMVSNIANQLAISIAHRPVNPEPIIPEYKGDYAKTVFLWSNSKPSCVKDDKEYKRFLKSITAGDPGVGDTLENALGISRNNSKAPDYKGIELKSTRLTRNGSSRPETRTTLFTKVPDVGCSYREIVENYGKIQVPRNSTEPRLQLYETCKVSRYNAYDLQLQIDINNDQLNLMHMEQRLRFVSAWYMKKLKETLLTKHKETFWVKAISENRDGWEFFRYDQIVHTKKPNASLLAPLLEKDKITIDLAGKAFIEYHNDVVFQR